MWDFETEPDYQRDLDWADQFVREEVEPLQYVLPHPLERDHPLWQALVPPLQQQVRDRGLWATHLGPELGGPGHGQVKLALLNEILGRVADGPDRVRLPGARQRQRRDPRPLRHRRAQGRRTCARCSNGEIFSCFSMTEPQGGSDPKEFTCSAVLDGDEWVINGEKWFSSNAQVRRRSSSSWS